MNEELIKKSIYNLLKAIGEDPEREGLKETPRRVAKMYRELLLYPKFEYTSFESKYDDLVMVKNIEFCSMCEHHLLPFYGVVHVSYIPNKRIIGLSKIARIVEKHSRKLQVQERMTEDIVNELEEILGTKNIAVFVEAKHMCMISRGVKKELTSTITTKLNGIFKDEKKSDFYFLLGKHD